MQAFTIFRHKVTPALWKDGEQESTPEMLFLTTRQKRRILLIGLKEAQELSRIRERLAQVYPELGEANERDLEGAIRDILDECNVHYLNDGAHYSVGF